MSGNTPLLDAAKEAAEMAKRGQEWAEADGQARLLEETKAPLLAQIAQEHAKESAAKADQLAKADERYTVHLMGMVEARTRANKAKIKYDTYRAYVEMLRTNASTDRAMMQLR
jgi:hypothetical protein